MKNRVITYCKNNRQFLLNIYLFINFLGWTLYQGYRLYAANRVDFAEVSFLLQNIVLTGVIILRKPHREIEKNILSQIVAIVAFFSGAAFMGQASSGPPMARTISEILMVVSSLLGIVTLVALGKSFGILIAVREVKSSGIYSIVRHPMYATDILLRIGFVISHVNNFTIIMLVLSTLCYCYRAMLEERFLSHFPEYREYKERVRYRFIPFVI
jgi:protein-S-isoprenylcysteine O-methyltransferase Ste14